jgi:hypothetical protein
MSWERSNIEEAYKTAFPKKTMTWDEKKPISDQLLRNQLRKATKYGVKAKPKPAGEKKLETDEGCNSVEKKVTSSSSGEKKLETDEGCNSVEKKVTSSSDSGSSSDSEGASSSSASSSSSSSSSDSEYQSCLIHNFNVHKCLLLATFLFFYSHVL